MLNIIYNKYIYNTNILHIFIFIKNNLLYIFGVNWLVLSGVIITLLVIKYLIKIFLSYLSG